jgi:acyl-CoA thioester hydrolase
MYFAQAGFSTTELARYGLDPVIRSDQIDYLREIHLLEEVRVTLTVAGLSPDASRFRLRNEFFRGGTTLAARITSLGGWLSQEPPALVAPPASLAAALQRLSRSPDYADIASKP